MLYCLVHFQRGVDRFKKHSAYQMMKKLPSLDKKTAKEFLEKLIQDPDSDLQGWAKHKKRGWILSGLNPHFSLLPRDVFATIEKTTNAIEGNHRRLNAAGINQSLLKAISM
jgi:hypothetical protein